MTASGSVNSVETGNSGSCIDVYDDRLLYAPPNLFFGKLTHIPTHPQSNPGSGGSGLSGLYRLSRKLQNSTSMQKRKAVFCGNTTSLPAAIYLPGCLSTMTTALDVGRETVTGSKGTMCVCVCVCVRERGGGG